MKLTLEMPAVSKCSVTSCAYNVGQGCRARAITVGDATYPNCDTFLSSGGPHSHETQRIAGVGACKVTSCKHNEDFECSAANIEVGYSDRKIHCLTYISKK